MWAFLLIYNILYIFLLLPFFCLFSIFNSKAREGLIGRLQQQKKIKAFDSNQFDKVVFFHSASVGEWEQSLPLIKKIKENQPSVGVVASFFSASGIKHANTKDVDLSIYLPFDTIFGVNSFFSKIKIDAWIISKYDVWPNFICKAHKKGIPMFLASAELANNSTRHKGIAAKINKIFYKYFTYIFPVSESYKQNFLNIFPYEERLIVAGDARYDTIISKAESAAQEIQLFEKEKEIKIIAGSIWPADEKHLLPALLKIYTEYNNVQMILAPHEINEAHINSIESFFYEQSISTQRYTELQGAESLADIVIVDTIGILSNLYKNTDIAYVGGAFSTGVHNVAEPAVFANPVIFGPKHENSHEAIQFVKNKCGFPISNTEDCYKTLKNLIENTQFRQETGQIAKDFLYKNKGATETIYSCVKKYI